MYASQGCVDHNAPRCFDSTEQWHEYTVAYYLSSSTKGYKGKPPRIDYCRDCTKKHKERMLAEGRCDHPETVFVRPDGVDKDVIGIALVDYKKSGAWEQAVMGMSGQVVTMPPGEVIDSVLGVLSRHKAGGRPKKEVTA
jgi:hypothetical protein